MQNYTIQFVYKQDHFAPTKTEQLIKQYYWFYSMCLKNVKNPTELYELHFDRTNSSRLEDSL